MRPMIKTVSSLGIFLALCAGSRAVAADDTGWQLELTSVGAQSTSTFGLDSDDSVGVGLDLEYRASRRLGLGLGVLTSEVGSELGLEFFDLDLLVIESSVRMTPVLARLDVHLTPDRKVDLFLGPVVGYVHYGDLRTEIRSDVLGESIPIDRVRTKDGFGWGGHIGVDVPIGNRGLFFTGRATYLKSELRARDVDEDEEGDPSFDLDPFVAQVGFGYRF